MEKETQTPEFSGRIEKPYRGVLFNGRRGLIIDNPAILKRSPWTYELYVGQDGQIWSPGAEVWSVGAFGKNGKETSSSRVDTYVIPARYMGTIVDPDVCSVKCLVIELNSFELIKHIAKRDLPATARAYALYLMYFPGELMVQLPEKLSTRVYRGILNEYTPKKGNFNQAHAATLRK